MTIKQKKNVIFGKYLILIFSLLFVLIGSVAMSTSNKVSAKDKTIQLSMTEETVQVNRVANFSIKLNNIEEDALTLSYPKSFQLNEERFRQENTDKIENIEITSEKHQLSFVLKNKQVNTVIFSGRFLQEGKQNIILQAGEEKEQVTVAVENSTEEIAEDEETISDLSTQETTTEMLPESSSITTVSTAEEISPRVTLPSFDWKQLNNDGLDLSTFKQVSVNTPVKLTGGVFDNQLRDYYMFFGHMGKSNIYNYTTGFSTIGNMFAPLGSDKKLPLLSPMMIGVKKPDGVQKSTGVFGYDYDYAFDSVGSSGANFDIGEVDPTTGSISKSGASLEGETTSTWITSQYVKDNEVVSYGFFETRGKAGTDTTPYYLPVRVHGYVVSEGTGRIRYDVSFYNDSTTDKDYAITYGAHMDVGGSHTNSQLFSYGKSGLYFNEPNKTPVDKLPARIYFYTNNGYGDAAGPKDYKSGNLTEASGGGGRGLFKISYWGSIKSEQWLHPMVGSTAPSEEWDPIQPLGYKFPLSHPVFALRWNKMNVKQGSVGTGSLDLSIEEPAPVIPSVEKTYENDRTSGEKAEVGDTLSFSVIARNRGDMDVWKQVELTDTLPQELELDTSSLKLVDVNGTESPLDPSIYDKASHKFTAGLYDIAAQSQVEIKYKAKIISGADQTIINKFAATNNLAQNASIDAKIPVHEKINYQVKQEVFHEDGKTVADNAVQGETLIYRTTVLNPKSLSNPSYTAFSANVTMDKNNLENIRNLTVKNEAGKSIGYGVIANTEVVFLGLDMEQLKNEPRNQNLVFEFEATVKEDALDGTIIKSKVNSFFGAFTDDSKTPQDIESNEVQTEINKKRGDLVFISAPKMLDFGQNLKISAKDQVYPIGTKDDDLVVEDHRGVGEKWSMNATLQKELTSTSGHELSNSLHYKDQKNDYIFTLGNAIPITEKETVDEQAVNISNDWSGTKIGPFLDVKAGKPRAEKYSGTIQWTLQDVPANE
ncbi:isopeptide-forming domain-containing fimbrial protein [Enterococcus ureasiticus]|uniref:isopeptide-forming domain-containing fimbrial protein n=1 Tax=Enterococcus ureasiticus TaxID=903984 RepID=UPI001A90B97E|nr:isopeptide-forming domain-containing fimbrial protein [Enterococcus ureasiticus]MBO0472275.1 isopeptide-forming domain-containing fimbrial protein [Enterococcus ureasiticus]